jgi:type IV fimbrial biogenesis protein FimT
MRRRVVRAGRGAGFTVAELMVVLAVAAILLTIAVPSLQSSLQLNRLDAASNQFVAVLATARSEAVKQGVQINVSSTNGNNNWTGGWVECCAPGSTTAPLQVGAPLGGTMTNYGSAAQIGFDATGRLVNNGVAANFIFCADGVDVTKSKGVTVALSGRVRIADQPINPAGAPLDNNELPMASCTAP